MSFESFIAFRHLTRRRKTGFISLISMISILGVAVGVMALIVVLGVMSGFDREFKSKIVNVQPHLRIEAFGGIRDAEAEIRRLTARPLPGLTGASAFVEGQAILRSERGATGVVVKGLDPVHENLTVYGSQFVDGELDLQDLIWMKTRRKFLFFKSVSKESLGSILIGQPLAEQLGVRVGDRVTLMAPFQGESKEFSLNRAEVRQFVVRGIYRIGMSDFDSSLVLVSVSQAQRLYHLGGRVTGIALRFQEVDDAERWKPVLAEEWGSGYLIRSWVDLNFYFLQALKVEKSVMTILLALIILVAAFNIVSTLTMVVMEKTKDVGILRALGATRMSIRKIFVMEGFSVGLFGVVAGAFLGILIARNLNPIADFIRDTTGLEVFPSDIYYFDRIPVELHGQDVIWIVGFAMLVSIAAGFYPAHRAAAIDPVKALHYE